MRLTPEEIKTLYSSLADKRLSVKQVESALKGAGLMPEWDYVRDRHWSEIVLMEINTLEEALTFLDELDKDNEEQTQPPFRWGCVRAKEARAWLKKETWNSTPRAIRVAIAAQRRTCCSCHLVGSYARRDTGCRDVKNDKPGD